MAVCKITVGYGATTPCPPPASGIYEDYIYLGNFEDVTFGTPSSSGVSATITMAGATTLYKLKVHRTGGDYSATLADNEDGGSEFTHRFEGRIVDISSTAYAFIQGAVGAKLVAVVRTKAGHFKILGLASGVFLKEEKEAATAGAVGHTFALVGEKQPTLPQTLLVTDLAGTLTALEAELT